ncbi:MAG TPA: DNA-processing protein DprA [Rhodanobacteraceae bacterium]|nr:DNA-processing protein DprA [Rhodanobacteraceae bacterium]
MTTADSAAPDEAIAWLALLRAPGLGAGAIRALVARHGSAQTVVAHARREASIPAAARDALCAPHGETQAADRRWLDQPGHHLIAFTSDDYPALLRDIPSAPAALFVAGDPTHLWSAQIAIVGSRNATASGLANARAFARAFAHSGNVVTSGLAEGIDGAAHAAALGAGAATIAVLGTGPDLIYPRQHADLAARIRANGALVSEFPPGTAGKPEHFPRRNRIIAGLSLGTLVIEAGLNSGSLITARLAAEQGREVFALPGSIHSPLARGCHKLIRDGALLVETADEVLEQLRGIGARLADHLRGRLRDGGSAAVSDTPLALPGKRDGQYTRLLAALDRAPASLDELAARSSLPIAALSSMLLVLELEGVVSAASGGRYVLAQ